AGSFTSSPFDSPAFAVFDELHLRPLPPPAIYLTWNRDPKILFLLQVSQVGQQFLVYNPLPGLLDVIRVHDKANEPVFRHDELNLPFPKAGRIIIKNVEQHVVLSSGHGQFQNVPNEKWND